MPRYRSRDGRYTVETVRLSCTPDRHDGEWVRVRFCGVWMADVRTIPDLELYVGLAELVDDDGLRHRPATRAELARRGRMARPASRPAPADREPITTRLARLLPAALGLGRAFPVRATSGYWAKGRRSRTAWQRSSPRVLAGAGSRSAGLAGGWPPGRGARASWQPGRAGGIVRRPVPDRGASRSSPAAHPQVAALRYGPGTLAVARSEPDENPAGTPGMTVMAGDRVRPPRRPGQITHWNTRTHWRNSRQPRV
jgi:hypothetical protein